MDNTRSYRQRTWYFLQRLEASTTLRERQQVVNMLAEEIFDVQKQIVELGFELPEWRCPVLTAGAMDVAFTLGHQLADHLQALCIYVDAQTDGEIWAVCRYDKYKIWDETQGLAQQPILPGLEEASGFSSLGKGFEHGLPVFCVIQGGKGA